MSEFTRKLPNLMDGSLVELETTELEAFKDYVSKMENEELEEGQEYPI
jgi:hypothetical protein